jgi:pilus assembly protein CpaB
MQLVRKRPGVPSFRGILSPRQATIAVALLSAVLATVLIMFALGRYRQDVKTGVQQQTVLVATGLIPKGTSASVIGTQQLYKPLPVLAGRVTGGALTDASVLQGKVAVSDILPGQQLLASDFEASTGITSQLAPGQRAVAVTLDAAHGLGGLVAAGDHVDVYGAFSYQNTPVVSLLVPNALVLRAQGGAAPSASNPSLVLAVSNAQAPQVAYAADNGKIWAVLRPPAATGRSAPAVTLNSILFGTSPSLKATPTSTTGVTG